MKYLSEWDQWKRYSSKSWKRFLEKAREMTTHLELWRDDIRSIEGAALPRASPAQAVGAGGLCPSTVSTSDGPHLGCVEPVSLPARGDLGSLPAPSG